jgi:hypothetical protein
LRFQVASLWLNLMWILDHEFWMLEVIPWSGRSFIFTFHVLGGVVTFYNNIISYLWEESL